MDNAALAAYAGRPGFSLAAWARRPDQRLWPLAAVMLLSAAGLVEHLPVRAALDAQPPAWIWPIAFALAEVCVVRIHFRRDAHAFSLSDIALVAGLFLASPTALLVSRVAGTVVVLIAVRHQPMRKVAFNGALVALSTAIALVTASALGLPATADSVGACGVALLAALAGETISMAAIHVALFVLEGTAPLQTLPRAFMFGAVGVLVNGSAGLLVAVTAPTHAWAPLLIVAPAATVLGIYRGYTKERREHQCAEFLYESASSLHRAGSDADPLADLLDRVRDLLGAGAVELLVIGAGGTEDEMFLATGEEGRRSSDRIPPDRHRVILAADRLGSDAVLIDTRRQSDAADRRLPNSAAQGVLVRLAAERGLRGALVATVGRGSVRRFDAGDARLLGALASHVVSYLEATKLGRQLEHQAYHDGLTQLANRALLGRRIAEALARSTSDGPQLALLFIDLDDFKLVNDAFGHAVGDRLLQAVADRLLRVVPPSSVVARLGGDEFAVLVDDPSRAGELASAVLEALHGPVALADTVLTVDASVGIAIARSDDDGESLLRHADLAMYLAKERGKRRYEVFDQTLQERVLQRQALRSDLERAAVRGQMELHYQPIVDLGTREITGVEALVRWRHPRRGLLAPDKFIQMAEETGLIVGLGEWVLRAAITDFMAWQRRQPLVKRLTVSVNVAARQLDQADFAEATLAALAEVGLPPDRLVVEITEGTLLGNRDLAVRHMSRLRAAGVRVAIDDFGTGYSSLGYLHTLPIDIVKIDKTFVRGLASDAGDRALTLAIVRLLDTLDVRTVAEGIETEEQLDYVAAMGCNQGQGFLFSRPVDGDTLLRLLAMQPFEGRAAEAS